MYRAFDTHAAGHEFNTQLGKCLSPSCLSCYWPKGGDALLLGR